MPQTILDFYLEIDDCENVKPTLRKYKPRKEMPLSEVKRLVAAAHLRQMEKLGMPQPKRKWGKFTFGGLGKT